MSQTVNQPSQIASLLRRLREKKLSYWLVAALILIFAEFSAPLLYKHFRLARARASFFQALLDWGPRPARPRYVKIVLVGNDEYWAGPLAGRRPIKRDYLATIVTNLAQKNVHIIALDFDVRLPTPQAFEIPADYRDETQKLIEAIRKAARSDKKVILATPISSAAKGKYHRDADIYQASGLCTSAAGIPSEAAMSNIFCGYIALPRDDLRIPPPIEMDDGTTMDSFAMAIARAQAPDSVERFTPDEQELGYLDFFTHDRLEKAKAIFSARDVRLGTLDQSALDSTIAIVGGGWSRDAINRGGLVDLHNTPVGPMLGVEMHANYAEAILDSRVRAGLSERVLVVAELVFGVLAAIVLGLLSRMWTKLFALCGLAGLAFVVSLLALHIRGVFFDAFIPLMGLGIHAVLEPYVERFEHYLKLRQAKSNVLAPHS
ncbi:CHASE2 domain-containing protein [Bradyrhizobium tropiciagri]|uniref:CHASE2 domain-containing protein n=1 Tax=Bradyrhizobium tropiciagri TaxID=312253 RepID=UPI00067C0BD9|nr:CHASE2 domain-containing protein [Bradyrhizobium tropiciagri]